MMRTQWIPSQALILAVLVFAAADLPAITAAAVTDATGTSGSGSPEAITERFESGRIDWSAGKIITAGMKPPQDKDTDPEAIRQKALAMARVAAQQRLLDTVKQVRIDAVTRVEAVVGRDPVIAAELEEMVRNQAEARSEYLSDGTVTVHLSLPLHGAFSQLLLPPELKQIEAVLPVDTVAPVDDGSSGAPRTPSAADDIYSGMVVDAHGLRFKPAMMPAIVDEDGHELFGAVTASREYAVQYGMSGFSVDLDAALIDPRIGSRPLLVKALRVNGAKVSELAISNSDAATLRSAPEHLTFLKQCRVIIVMDPPTPSEPAPQPAASQRD